MYRLLTKNRQLFINNNIAEVGRSEHRYGFHNIQRRMHQPQKQGLVILPDRPWESPVIELLSSCVLFDEAKQIFRMWYGCFERVWYPPCNMEVESCFILYAESGDGMNWAKPTLGLYEYEGSKENNICLKSPGCGAMWHGVLYDPDDDNPDRRYKMFAHGTVGADHGELVFFSPDGIHWKPYEHNPVLYTRVDTGDSHSLMGCRDPKTGRFVASMRPVDWYLSYPDIPYYRYDRGDPQEDKLNATFSHRRVGISVSDDFTCWGSIKEVLQADLDDPPGTQMQGMNLCPYEDVYLGFIMMHYADGMNFTFDGDTLSVNADASHGELSVEILDERLVPFKGYRSRPFSGDSVGREISWLDGGNFAALEGKAVRLKFMLKDTDLYSFHIT